MEIAVVVEMREGRIESRVREVKEEENIALVWINGNICG